MESGQTLYQISHLYEIEVLDVLKANPRIQAHAIYPKQKILIPGRKTIKTTPFVWPKELEEPSKTQEMVKPKLETKKEEPIPIKQDVKPLQFNWPGSKKVISSFGKRQNKMHNGIDVQFNVLGNVLAAGDGKVVYADDEVKGYGNLIIINHVGSYYSVYAYLAKLLVKKGDVIKMGQTIANVSASPSQSFIHFEIRKGKQALDPIKFLPHR